MNYIVIIQDNLIINIENSKEYTKPTKLNKWIYIKIIRYKIKVQKSIVFPYACHKQFEIKM